MLQIFVGMALGIALGLFAGFNIFDWMMITSIVIIAFLIVCFIHPFRSLAFGGTMMLMTYAMTVAILMIFGVK